MFDLRDTDDGADAATDSTWRRFEAILAADRRGTAPAARAATVAPRTAPAARRAGAFRAGFWGGVAGVALALVALAALGPQDGAGPPRSAAPAPVAMIVAPAAPAAMDAPRPARPALGAAGPRRGAAAPPLSFQRGGELWAIAGAAPTGVEAAPPQPLARAASRPWVVVHVAQDAATARRLAATLRAAGFARVRIKQVPAGVAQADLRFFHAADRDAALAAARAAEGALPQAPVRDFTHYRPSPETGLIEFWLN